MNLQSVGVRGFVALVLLAWGVRAQVPVIVVPPSDVFVAAGEPAAMEVAAEGSALTYRWERNGVAIPGLVGPRLEFPAVSTADEASYRCIVANNSGAVTSRFASVLVLGSGGSVQFSQTGLSPAPLVYDVDGVTRLSGGQYLAQLFAGATPGTLKPTGPAVSFLSGNLAGRWVGGSRFVDGVNPGQAAHVQVRVWPSGFDTFDAATSAGARIGLSAVLNLLTGGVGTPPSLPAPLAGLSAFQLVFAQPPVIATGPTGVEVSSGTSVTLQVAVEGVGPFQYRWQRNGVDVPGATGASLVLNPVSAALAGSYRVVVANPFGATISRLAVVSVLGSGGTLQFSASLMNVRVFDVNGTTPLAGDGFLAQLYAGPELGPLQPVGAAVPFLSGANTSGLWVGGVRMISSVPPGGLARIQVRAWPLAGGPDFETALAGGFPVGASRVMAPVVLGGVGSPPTIPAVVSGVGNFALSGELAPSITEEPRSVQVVAGQTASFRVTVLGSNPKYLWRRDGEIIPGAGAAALVLGSVTTEMAGEYQVEVSNSKGTVTSRVALLTVLVPPVVTQDPVGGVFAVGTKVTLSGAAEGSAPLKYQWRKNAQEVAGATQLSLELGSAQLGDSGSYTLRVSNAAGSVETKAAVVTVLVPPSITQEPVDQEVPAGATVSFSVGAAGGLPLSYEWRRNGELLAGQNSAQLVLTGVQAAQEGTYSARVRNPVGVVDSRQARLKVLSAPVITGQPVGAEVFPGTDVVLNVEAGGAAPLSYQWQRNGKDLAGATGSSLSLPAVQGAQAGSYGVRVQNSFGVALSTFAVVDVRESGGTVQFSGVPTQSRVFREDGVTPLAGDGWLAQLYAGVPDGALVPVGAAVPFLGGATTAGYWRPGTRGVPGVPAGSPARVQVRVWPVEQGATFEEALAAKVPVGVSALLSLPALGGVGNPPALPAGMSGLTSFALRRIEPVVITRGPQPLSVPVGEAARFTVEFTGTTPVQIVWRRNGVPIPGASQAELVLGPVDPGMEGDYSVEVANELGTAASGPARLRALLPLAISGQPTGGLFFAGTRVELRVAAVGNPAPAYRWRFNGEEVAGQTGPVLVLDPLLPEMAGSYVAVVSNRDGSLESVPAVVGVVIPPRDTRIPFGDPARLEVQFSGGPVPGFRWFREGSGPLPGATGPGLEFPALRGPDLGRYQVEITGPQGTLLSPWVRLEGSGPLTFLGPIVGPANPVALGSPATLEILAAGDPSLSYQWYRNGRALAGATGATWNSGSYTPAEGGAYTVWITDGSGSKESAPHVMIPAVPELPATDAFSLTGNNRLPGDSGVGRTDLAQATREAGEPVHAGDAQAGSRWLAWVPGVSGIATWNSSGSALPVVLSVYRARNPQNVQLGDLALVVEGDPAASTVPDTRLAFNVTAGTTYFLAVSGRPTVSGSVVLSWSLEETTQPLPELVTQPRSVVAGSGAPAALLVEPQVPPGGTVQVQWYQDGQSVPGATSPSLGVNSVNESAVGKYYAAVTVRYPDGTARITQTELAEIQLYERSNGTDASLLARDSLQQIQADLQRGGRPAAPAGARPAGLSRGVSGTQVFTTRGETRDVGEPVHCGTAGGASKWYPLIVDAAGTVTVDTIGTGFDTVLAVYVDTGLGTGLYDGLQEVACNNDRAPGQSTSSVTFCARAGTIYLVAVDGVNGATGTVRLNYAMSDQNPGGLCEPPAIPCPPRLVERVAPVGGEVTLTATVTGTPPLKLTWYRGETEIGGSSGPSLTLKGVTAAAAGTYRLKVSSPEGEVERDVARVTVVTGSQPVLGFEEGCDGSVRFTVAGAPNTPYALEATTDLLTWTRLFTGSSPTGILELPVLSPGETAGRIYRAVRP